MGSHGFGGDLALPPSVPRPCGPPLRHCFTGIYPSPEFDVDEQRAHLVADPFRGRSQADAASSRAVDSRQALAKADRNPRSDGFGGLAPRPRIARRHSLSATLDGRMSPPHSDAEGITEDFPQVSPEVSPEFSPEFSGISTWAPPLFSP